MGTGPERGDGLEHRSGDDAADGGPVREQVAEKIAEQMAEQAQNFDLYDLAPLGCCAVSEAGEIMHADGTAAALFGVSRSALVGQPIFRFIAADDAPAFAELADRVRDLFTGCIFVAHNARFDYGFIKNEFRRIGQDFDAPVLCTVKLSRALYPQFHRHGLDALIERHGLVCAARHRAMGDVEVLWQFVRQVEAAFAPEVLARAVERAMKAPVLPPGLPGLTERIRVRFGEAGALRVDTGSGTHFRAEIELPWKAA